jgi:hypothetical protein
VTFERHGIDHLSASSLNLWMANPRVETFAAAQQFGI